MLRSFMRITGTLALTALLGACGEAVPTAGIADTGEPKAEVITGVLEVAIVDLEDSAYHLVSLHTEGGETLRLQLRNDQLETVRGGDTVSVLGVRKGDEIDLTKSGTLFSGSTGEVGTTRSALVTAGPRTTAVVLFNFRNDTTQPVSKVQAQTALFSAANSMNAYYQEISQRAISITGILDKVNGDAFGYYTIDADNTNCSNPFAWTDQADLVAKSQGVDLSKYAHVVYIAPDQASCGWAGIAHLPGRKAIIKASTLTQFPKVVTHEFGHNLGFAHANVFRCTNSGSSVALSATCSSEEYGDILDPMGIATPRTPTHTNIRNKSDASWFSSRVLEVTASGEYSFAAANGTAAGPLGLRIARGDGTYLWLETRTLTGFDAQSITSATHAVYNGVTIRVARPAGNVQSQLVDAVPATRSVDDAPFLTGTSLADPVGKVTLTVLSVAGGIAKVKVDLTGAPPPPPSTTPPPPPPPPTSSDLVVRVTSAYSGLPLSVVGASKASGAAIEQASYLGATHQQMRFQGTQGGFLVRPVHSDMCLAIAGDSRSAGAPVWQVTCNSQASQVFRPESSSTGGYRLRNANSNLCLDIANASRSPGASIVQQACSTSTTQVWRLYLP